MPAIQRLLALGAVLLGLAIGPSSAHANIAVKPVLASLPDDITAVVAADVRGSATSPMMPALQKAVVGWSGPLGSLLVTTKAGAPTVDSYVCAIAAPMALTQKGWIFLLDGSFPADMLDSTTYSGMATDRGITVYTINGFEAALIGNRLAVADPGQLARLIDLHIGGRSKTKSAATSKKAAALRAAIAGTNTSRSAWGVALNTGMLGSAFSSQGLTVSWSSMSLGLGKDLFMESRTMLDSPASAAGLVTTAQTALAAVRPQAGAMGMGATVASLQISSTKSVFEASLTMSSGELNTLLSLSRMLIP